MSSHVQKCTQQHQHREVAIVRILDGVYFTCNADRNSFQAMKWHAPAFYQLNADLLNLRPKNINRTSQVIVNLITHAAVMSCWLVAQNVHQMKMHLIFNIIKCAKSRRKTAFPILSCVFGRFVIVCYVFSACIWHEICSHSHFVFREQKEEEKNMYGRFGVTNHKRHLLSICFCGCD